MYVQAQYSIITAVLTILLLPIGVTFEIFSLLLLPAQLIYFAFCLKRMYQLTFAEILLKTLIFFIILGVVGAVIGAFSSYIMYKTGMMDEMIEAQKAIIDAQKAAKDSLN